eukprot:TRINITY_DN9915_c0_g1_i4.p3 TRINITY_DN9915_c0_g1~~TRINITY_DN9915_c0_g1_i4.p3  ORF type:complete len:109 (+),score=10.53 TRINITY_DN9915_c0_g1_i4:317-643(+)
MDYGRTELEGVHSQHVEHLKPLDSTTAAICTGVLRHRRVFADAIDAAAGLPAGTCGDTFDSVRTIALHVPATIRRVCSAPRGPWADCCGGGWELCSTYTAAIESRNHR